MCSVGGSILLVIHSVVIHSVVIVVIVVSKIIAVIHVIALAARL
jgi:hypothetical protein